MIKTLLKCHQCHWISEPQTQQQMANRGVPWYCDRCGERVTKFVDYLLGEEIEAQTEINRY